MSVEADCKHEAGYDAMMTGVLWFKLQSMLAHPTQSFFPGVESILANNFSNISDKNKVPMASIRHSLNLEQTSQDDAAKPFLFVVTDVPLHLETEDI